MKRLHVHVSVEDIKQSVGFYSALFAAQPSVLKPDYAKWMLEDPRGSGENQARVAHEKQSSACCAPKAESKQPSACC